MNGPAHPNPYPGAPPYGGEHGYGEAAGGGHYAYVIRADDGVAPSPARARRAAEHVPNPQQQPRNQQPPREPLVLESAPAAPGPGREVGDPAIVDPALAYGPDDPAYGPPGPGWYERAEETRRQEAEEELRKARGAFEPLPADHVISAPEPPGELPSGSYPSMILTAESSGDRHGELPGDPGDDLDVAQLGRGAEPLAGIKDLYLTAESIGDRRLDEHFEQLLERQRELISEFFTKTEFHVHARSGGQEDLDGPEGERLSVGGAPWSRR